MASTDYATWTQTELIARVSELEAQLRAQTREAALRNRSSSSPTATSAAVTPTNTDIPVRKKQKKQAKPFDASKYSTRYIALKFAYLGGRYNGFEHHNNTSTKRPAVEKELWKALRKTKLISPLPTRGADGGEGGAGNGDGEEDVSWEGCEYSKCGRTDKGVSAFGQVIGLRVRSARPLRKKDKSTDERATSGTDDLSVEADGETNRDIQDREPLNSEAESEEKAFDSLKDELPYIQILNRNLPPDIRVLAWCPDPPADFSARFSCRERRYRYFFTNPAYMPSLPSARHGEGWLDIEAMREAAKKYEGLHDFRNFCKIDASKQITNFERRIFYSGIHAVSPSGEAGSFLPSEAEESGQISALSKAPQLYYFEVRGSAFLWHQVRNLVAILFLVGQGYEKPSIVDDLLDVQKTPGRPVYEMASDTPLVLWDCIFPEFALADSADHTSGAASTSGYEDALRWIYVGDEAGGRDKTRLSGIVNGKYGREGVMEDLWGLWRKRKLDEVLAGSLMNLVAGQGEASSAGEGSKSAMTERDSRARLFDGSEEPNSVGPYVPVMRRERMETPDVLNARYALRKGLIGRPATDIDVDE